MNGAYFASCLPARKIESVTSKEMNSVTPIHQIPKEYIRLFPCESPFDEL